MPLLAEAASRLKRFWLTAVNIKQDRCHVQLPSSLLGSDRALPVRTGRSPGSWRRPLRPDTARWGELESLPDDAQIARDAIQRGGCESVHTLLAQMRAGPSFRWKLLGALSSVGSRLVPELVSAFDHPDERVRLAAIRAFTAMPGDLRRHGLCAAPGLAKALWDSSLEIKYAAALAWERLDASRTEAVPGLVRALSAHETLGNDDAVRLQQLAAHLLGRIGPAAASARPQLTTLLDHPSSNLRQEALVALWRMTQDRERIVARIAAMLEETNMAARMAAAAAVRRLSDELCLDPALIDAAEGVRAN